MNTKTLVVGQKVTMRSGPLSKEGTVIEVTEEYVRVEFEPAKEGQRWGVSIDFWPDDGVQQGWFEGEQWCGHDLCSENRSPWRLEL